MTSELTQIVNLVKSKNEKVENICYKEVHKININKEDGNNPVVFNTKSVLSKLVDYSNAYIQFQLILNLQQQMLVQKPIYFSKIHMK